MNARLLHQLLSRCLAAARRVLGGPRGPMGSPATEATSSEFAALSMRETTGWAGLAEPHAPPVAQDFAAAAEEPAVQPRLRTLEEVRADLAALRERTRVLHAQAQQRRDMSFAPTDFMDFADAKAAPVESPASGFAPTDFLDFGMPELQPGR